MRPPLPRAMRLANLPVASLPRNFWNIRIRLSFFYSLLRLVGLVCAVL